MKMSIDITLTLVQLMSNGLKVRVNIKSISPLFWERYKLKVLLLPPCSVNSVDRMPLLQSGSRWFESITEHHNSRSSNGRTNGFGPFNRGSNPCWETIYKVAVQGPLAGVANGRLGYVEGCR